MRRRHLLPQPRYLAFRNRFTFFYNQNRSPPMEYFGDNIRAAREQRGLKQINVANACNMKQQYISDLERNKKNPSDTPCAASPKTA